MHIHRVIPVSKPFSAYIEHYVRENPDAEIQIDLMHINYIQSPSNFYERNN